MRIAVVTGASSGQGREFVMQLQQRLPDLDEIWLIARDEKALRGVALLSGVPCVVFPLDLTKNEAYEAYKKALADKNPNIALLVNAAGFGKFGETASVPLGETEDMMKLNMISTVMMSIISLDYMKSGAHIINMSSVSAFSPLPYFNIYAATKAFVLSFSRSLSNELKKRDINVTAVCPYWVNTHFIPVAKAVPQPMAVTDFRFIREASRVVNKALHDAYCGRQTSLYGITEYLLLALSKLFPVRLKMAAWNSVRCLDAQAVRINTGRLF